MPRLRHDTLGTSSVSVSSLGLGGAPFGGLFSKVPGDEAGAAIHAALRAGIDYIDTAPFYGFGRSERIIGDRLRDHRGHHVVSTKVGRLLRPGAIADPGRLGWPQALPFTPVFDYSYEAIMRSWEDSLQRLGIDSVDILYLHDIGERTHGEGHREHFDAAMSGGYRALDELRRNGHIGAFGLGVNEVAVCLAALQHGDWDVFLLAGRYTLLEQAALDDLFPQCRDTTTSIVIGGPFNSGILAGGTSFDYADAPPGIVERVKALTRICRHHDVPLGAAALQFPAAHEQVASVIPGPRNEAELADIIDWASRSIAGDFWKDLAAAGLLNGLAPLPTSNPFLDPEPA